MKKLTIEHAIKNKFSAIDLVRYFKPDWSSEECEFFLWEKTCYPFSIKSTIEQLNNHFIN